MHQDCWNWEDRTVLLSKCACRKEEGETLLLATARCSLSYLRTNVITVAKYLRKWKRSCNDLGMMTFAQQLDQAGGFHWVESWGWTTLLMLGCWGLTGLEGLLRRLCSFSCVSRRRLRGSTKCFPSGLTKRGKCGKERKGLEVMFMFLLKQSPCVFFGYFSDSSSGDPYRLGKTLW